MVSCYLSVVCKHVEHMGIESIPWKIDAADHLRSWGGGGKLQSKIQDAPEVGFPNY